MLYRQDLQLLYSNFPKVASKGVIKKNAANNKKAALGKKLNSIEK